MVFFAEWEKNKGKEKWTFLFILSQVIFHIPPENAIMRKYEILPKKKTKNRAKSCIMWVSVLPPRERVVVERGRRMVNKLDKFSQSESYFQAFFLNIFNTKSNFDADFFPQLCVYVHSYIFTQFHSSIHRNLHTQAREKNSTTWLSPHYPILLLITHSIENLSHSYQSLHSVFYTNAFIGFSLY